MLNTIILGYILTWFNFDNFVIEGINQIFNTDFTIAVYWLIIFCLGILVKIFKKK